MSNVTIRIDDNLKEQSQELLQKMGLTLNAGINMFLSQLCIDKGLPFQPHTDPFYSLENQKWILESIEQLKQGKVIVKTLDELREYENE